MSPAVRAASSDGDRFVKRSMMSISSSANLAPPFSMNDDGTYAAKNCPPTSPFFNRGMSVSIASVLSGSIFSRLPWASPWIISGKSLCVSIIGTSRCRRLACASNATVSLAVEWLCASVGELPAASAAPNTRSFLTEVMCGAVSR